MPKVQSECECCGKSIEFYPSQKRRFCSLACRAKVQAPIVWSKRETKPSKPRRGVQVACSICGRVVYRMQAHAARKGEVFCSQACKHQSQRRGSLDKACVICGTQFRVSPSQIDRQYCSKSCNAVGAVKRPLDREYNGRPAHLDIHGYVLVWEPEHPNKALNGWQYEHRLMMEKKLGRLLRSDEHVDHIDGTKRNDYDNLQVLSHGDHSRKTGHDRRKRRENLEAENASLKAELEAYRQRFGPLPEQE